MSERREHQRAPYLEEVEIIHKHHSTPVSSFDISAGGIGVRFLGVPTASTVKLVMPIPHGKDREPVVLTGEVAWRKVGSAGIRFVNAPPEAIAQIQDYVNKYSGS